MDHYHGYNSRPRRGGVWSLIGYLSFGILGIMLGAVLVYALFVFLLMPSTEIVVSEEEVIEEEKITDEVETDQVEEVDEPEVDEVDEPEEAIPDHQEPLPVLPWDHHVVDTVDKVMPAVVGVSSRREVQGFGGRHFEQTESGSGVIIDSGGYIITNQHVIDNADEVFIVIPDKGFYEAELVGSDLLTDLALLKIDENDLSYVDFADSNNIRVGESVLAIGNPLGLQQTVTAGIISAVERQVRIPGTEFSYTFVQTDAVVNPGNSGGPLVNLEGDIVGINTAKIALSGVEGIGLAIPSNTVERVTRDFLNHGSVQRPHMGVLIEDWLDYEDPEPVMGVRIVEVSPGSPAYQAGLMGGDIIVAIEGSPINYMAQLFDKLLVYYPEDEVTITYFRNGEENQTNLVFDLRPEQFNEDPLDPEEPGDDD